MKIQNDFRADMTVCELLQYLEDRQEKGLRRLEEAENEYDSLDEDDKRLPIVESKIIRIERCLSRRSDAIKAIYLYASMLSDIDDCDF